MDRHREPDWWRGAVIYQIWPRSFMDGNGDGIGDLPGIIQRLDYLNDGRGGGLGVDGIWISPFFASPQADYGYDISGYTSVDPTFGTMEDFDRLVIEANRRSIEVLLDLVPNHTSDEHPWFIESRSSRDNPRRDWYVWRDPGPDGGVPNNWKSAFGSVGPAWTFDERTGQYFLHSYTPSQPDLNWDNSEVRDAIKEVMRFWLDRGVAGFRIDVVHRLAKDPALGDNPPGLDALEPETPGRHDADWSSIDERLADLRSVADEYEGAVLVGEVYILDQRRLVTYIGPGKLHLGHNFVFLNQPWQADAIASVVDEFEGLVSDGLDGAWCLNNHDHSRTATRFGRDGRGEEKARSAAVLVLGLRGTPFIYQGEELALPDTDLDPELVVDVDGRDGCRTPIPWEAPSRHPGAGFTSGEPWLPIGAAAEVLNAHDQIRDESSAHSLYRNLIALRRARETLRRGTYRSHGVTDGVFIYERRFGAESVLVLVNFGSDQHRVEGLLSRIGADDQATRVLVSSLPVYDSGVLAGFEARWVQQENPQKNA